MGSPDAQATAAPCENVVPTRPQCDSVACASGERLPREPQNLVWTTH